MRMTHQHSGTDTGDPVDRTQTPPDPSRLRWERICDSLEALIEAWIDTTVVTPDKDWTTQLTAITLAAQRAAGLRVTLENGDADNTGENDDDTQASQAETRRHWAALLQEEDDADEDDTDAR
jgi:hypothetical protein